MELRRVKMPIRGPGENRTRVSAMRMLCTTTVLQAHHLPNIITLARPRDKGWCPPARIARSFLSGRMTRRPGPPWAETRP